MNILGFKSKSKSKTNLSEQSILPITPPLPSFFDLNLVTEEQLQKDIDNLNKINLKIVEKIEKEENNSHEIERLINIYNNIRYKMISFNIYMYMSKL